MFWLLKIIWWTLHFSASSVLDWCSLFDQNFLKCSMLDLQLLNHVCLITHLIIQLLFCWAIYHWWHASSFIILHFQVYPRDPFMNNSQIIHALYQETSILKTIWSIFLCKPLMFQDFHLFAHILFIHIWLLSQPCHVKYWFTIFDFTWKAWELFKLRADIDQLLNQES